MCETLYYFIITKKIESEVFIKFVVSAIGVVEMEGWSLKCSEGVFLILCVGGIYVVILRTIFYLPLFISRLPHSRLT